MAVGVMVLITALSTMNGMRKELQGALRGAESDMTIYSVLEEGFSWDEKAPLVDTIKAEIDIKAHAPFTLHQAFVMGPQKPMGTLIKGIDLLQEPKVTPLDFLIRTESFETKRDNTNPNREIEEAEREKAQSILSQLAPHFETVKDRFGNIRKNEVHGIIIGSQLARNLGVGIDDTVTIMSLENRITPMSGTPRTKRFKVIAFFETGLPAYDEIFSMIEIGIAQKIFRMEGKISGLTISLEDESKADVYMQKLRKNIGYPYYFTTWMEQNKNMFAIFRLQQLALATILTLIILLASFLIVSSLVMLVVEKTKDIAILKAMGAKDSSIRNIFIFQGLLIGLTGIAIGEILGLLTCWIVSSFDIIDIPPGVYVGNRIPMDVKISELVLVAVVSLLICFFVTIVPSHKAAKLDPVEGMRNE